MTLPLRASSHGPIAMSPGAPWAASATRRIDATLSATCSGLEYLMARGTNTPGGHRPGSPPKPAGVITAAPPSDRGKYPANGRRRTTRELEQPATLRDGPPNPHDH